MLFRSWPKIQYGWEMTRWFCLILSVVVVLVVSVSPAAEPGAEPRPVILAQRAPVFVLTDLAGREVRSEDFAQPTLLVCFWVHSDAPSQRQVKILEQIRNDYGSNRVQVIGISLHTGDDTPVKDYLASVKLTFPVLKYSGKVVTEFGGITAVPTTFVVDRNRNIIRQHVGLVQTNALREDIDLTLRDYHETESTD